MGTTLGKPFAVFFQENEPIIVLFGLNGAGKSSIVHKLNTGEVLTMYMPTFGFDLQSVKYKDSTLHFWEVGGLQPLLHLWKHYFREVSGLVLVVDSSDRDGTEEAKNFLNKVIDEIQGIIPDNVPVLVYGNKCEVPGAMSASEISKTLDLASFRQRNWHVPSSCAICGNGLHEGLDWLMKNIGNCNKRS